MPCRGLLAPGQVQAFTTAAAVADLSLGLQPFFLTNRGSRELSGSKQSLHSFFLGVCRVRSVFSK